MELLGEFTILILFSHFICFTDFVVDLEARTWIGWSLIAITSMSILLNVLLLLKGNAVILIKKCKRCKRKTQDRKAAEARREKPPNLS